MMEHEFVPGKRRCRNCDVKWGYRNDFPCCEADADGNPAALPGPEKQTWHLNIWTSVNGVIFTGSHQYDGEDVVGWAITEADNKVQEIIAASTPKEEEEEE